MDASDSVSPDCINNGGDEFGDLLILPGNDSAGRHRLQRYRPPLATIDESTCTPTGKIGNSVGEIPSRNQGDLSVLQQEFIENKNSGNYKILMNKSLCNRTLPNNVETIYQKKNWNEYDNEDNIKKTNAIDETFDDRCKLSQSCGTECVNDDSALLCSDCQQEDCSKVVQLSPKPSLHDMRSNITSDERLTFETDTDSFRTEIMTGSGMEKSSSPEREDNTETSDYSEFDEIQAIKKHSFNRVPNVVLGVMSSVSLSSTDSIREIIKKERTDYKTYKQQHQSLHKKLWTQRSPIPIYSSSHAFESTSDHVIETRQVASKTEQTSKIEVLLPEKPATAPTVVENDNVDTEIKKALQNIETNEVQLQKYVRNVREKLTLPSQQIDKIDDATEESDKCRNDNQKSALTIERADGIKNKVDSKPRTMINQPAGDNIARLKSIAKVQQFEDYKVKEESKILTYVKPQIVMPEVKPTFGTVLSSNESVKRYVEEVKQSATSSRSYFERCLNLLKKKASDFVESNKQETYKEQKQEIIQEKPKVKNDVLLINQIRNRIDETYRQANYYSNIYSNKMPVEIENTIKSIEDAIKTINENNSTDKKLTRKNKQDLSVLIDKLNFIASYHKKIKVSSRKKKTFAGDQSKNSNETYGDRSMNVNYRSIESRLGRKPNNNYNEHKFTPKKSSIIKLIDTQLSAHACEKYNMQTILAPHKNRNRISPHVNSRLYKSKQFKQLTGESVHRCNSLFCSDKCKMVVEDMGKLKLEKRRIPSEEMIFKFEIKRGEHSASGDTKTQEDTGPSIVDRALIDQIREDYLRIQKRPRRIIRKKSSTSTVTATSTIDIDTIASTTERKILDNEALSNITRETIAPLVAEYPKHVYTKKVLPEPEIGRHKKSRTPTPTRRPLQALKTAQKRAKSLSRKTNESSIISVVQDAQEETVNQNQESPPIDDSVKYNTADEETVSTDLEASSATQEKTFLSETAKKYTDTSVVSVTKLKELLEDPSAKFNPQYTVMPVYKTVLFAKKDIPEKPFENVKSPVRSYIHGLSKETKSRVDSSIAEKINNRFSNAKKNFAKNQSDDRAPNKSTEISEKSFLSNKLGHTYPEKVKMQNTIKNVLIKNEKTAMEDIGEIVPNAEHPKLLDSIGSVEIKPKQVLNKNLSQKSTVYLENFNKNVNNNNKGQVKPKVVLPALKRNLTTEPNAKGKFTNIKHGHRENVYAIIDDILTLTKPISQQKPKSRQNINSGDEIENVNRKKSSHAELNKRMKNIKSKLEMDKIKFVKSLMKILSDETISDTENVPKLGNAGEMFCPLQRKNSTLCMIEKGSDASISLRNSRQINMAVTNLINIVDQVTDEVAKLTTKYIPTKGDDNNFAKSKSSSNLSSDHLTKLKSVSVSGSERSFTEKPQTPKTRRMHSADVAKTSKNTNKGSNSLDAITKRKTPTTPTDKTTECPSNEIVSEKLKDAEYFLGQIKSSTENLLRTLFEKRSAMVRKDGSSFMCTSSDTHTELSDDESDYKMCESHKSIELNASGKSSLVSIYNSHDASTASASDARLKESNKTPSNQNNSTEKRVRCVTPVVKESKSQSINKEQYKQVITTTKSLLKIINDEIKVLQEKNESLSEHEQLKETRIFLDEIKSKTETLFLTIKGEKSKSRENTNQDTIQSKISKKACSVGSEAITCARYAIDKILSAIDHKKRLNIDATTISNIDVKNSNIDDTKISKIEEKKISNIDVTKIPNTDDKNISNISDAKTLNIDVTKKSNIDDEMEPDHSLHRTTTDLLFEKLEEALQPENENQTDVDKAEPICKTGLSQNSDKKLKELFSPRSLKSSNMVLEPDMFLSSSTNQVDVMTSEGFTNSQTSHCSMSISTTAVCDFSASDIEFEKSSESENKINNSEPVIPEVKTNGTKDRWLETKCDFKKMDETLDDIENKVSIKDLISFIDRTAAEQEEYLCQPEKEPKTPRADARKNLTILLSTDEDYRKKIASKKQSLNLDENLKIIKTEKDLESVDKNCQQKITNEKQNYKTDETEKLQDVKNLSANKVSIDKNSQKKTAFEKQNEKTEKNIKKPIITKKILQNDKDASVCKKVPIDEKCQKKIVFHKTDENTKAIKTKEVSQNVENLSACKGSTDENYQKKIELEKPKFKINKSLSATKTIESQHVLDLLGRKLSTDKRSEQNVKIEKQNIETDENFQTIKTKEIQHVKDSSICKVSTDGKCQKKIDFEKQNIKAGENVSIEENSEKETEKQNIETNENLKTIKPEELQQVQDTSECKVSANKKCQKEAELEKQNTETDENLKAIKTEELQHVKDSSVCKVFTNKICEKKAELEKQNTKTNENLKAIKTEELQHVNVSSICKAFTDRRFQEKTELEKQNIITDQNVSIEENIEKKTEKQTIETDENLKGTKTEEFQKDACKIITDENWQQKIVHEKPNIKTDDNLKATKTEELQKIACHAFTDQICQQKIVDEEQNIKTDENLKATKTEELQKIACQAFTDEICQQKIVNEKQNIKTDENLKATKTEELQKVACQASTDETCQQKIVIEKHIKIDENLKSLRTEEKSTSQKQKNTQEKPKEMPKINHNLNLADSKNTSQIADVKQSAKCSSRKCVRCGKARENSASQSNSKKPIQRMRSSCSLPNYDTSSLPIISSDGSKTAQATVENQSNCFKETKQCETTKIPKNLDNLTRDADSKNKQNASSDLPDSKILPAAFPEEFKITKPKCENKTSEKKNILEDSLENKDNLTSDLKNPNATGRYYDHTDGAYSEVSDFFDSDDNLSLSSFDLPWGSPDMKHSDKNLRYFQEMYRSHCIKNNSICNLHPQTDEDMFQKGNYYLLRKFILDEDAENESKPNISEVTSDKSMSRVSDHFLKGTDSCQVPRCVRCGNSINRKMSCDLRPQIKPDGSSKPCTLCFKHYLLLHDNSNLPKETIQKLMRSSRMRQICHSHQASERDFKSEIVSSKTNTERNTLNTHESGKIPKKETTDSESSEKLEEKVTVSTNDEQSLIDTPTCVLENDNCILGNPSYKMVEEEQNESLINDNNNIVKMELSAITKLVNKYLSNIDDNKSGKESSEEHHIDSKTVDDAAAIDTSDLDQNENSNDDGTIIDDEEPLHCTYNTEFETKTLVEYNRSSDTNIVEVIEMETKALKELVEQYIDRIESRKRNRSRRRCLFKRYSFTRKEYRPTKFSNNEHVISLIVSAAYISLFVFVFGCLSFHIHYCDF